MELEIHIESELELEPDLQYIFSQPSHTSPRSRTPLSPERVPPSPSHSPTFSQPSYSPVFSPEDNRPCSPADSTSSVEFLEEISFISPPPRYYFFGFHDTYYSFITQFPLLTTPLPPNTFSLSSEGFDLKELRITISDLSPNSRISLFLPGARHPHFVPIQVFYNMFPLISARLEELSPSPTPSQ